MCGVHRGSGLAGPGRINVSSILYFTLTESGLSLRVQVEAAGPLSSQPWVPPFCFTLQRLRGDAPALSSGIRVT